MIKNSKRISSQQMHGHICLVYTSMRVLTKLKNVKPLILYSFVSLDKINYLKDTKIRLAERAMNFRLKCSVFIRLTEPSFSTKNDLAQILSDTCKIQLFFQAHCNFTQYFMYLIKCGFGFSIIIIM